MTRIALGAVSLFVLVAALVGTVTGGGTLGRPGVLDGWYLADLVLFGVAVALVRRVPGRWAVGLVLAGSVAVAATGLLAPPRTSDDAYRYRWDGRVQAAGVSPYRYAPDDPALAGLRERSPDLFPPEGPCTGWDERRTAAGQCSHLNRPGVPTIYPPVAEGWFLALEGAGGGVRTAQLGGALLAVATTGLLLVRRRPARAALWGWCPGVALWAVNDAHVDTLGVLLLVAALLVAARGRRVAGGVLFGASIAAKLVPAVALPGALSGVLARRPRWRDLVLPAVAVATVVVTYLPYLWASGSGVLGYLPGYLREEGYDQDSVQRFGLLRLVLPAGLTPYAAAAVLLAVVLHVLRRGDPAQPWAGALLVTGTALLLAAPNYPWYGLLVVALAALDGRWEWLAVPAAGTVVYLHGGGAQQAAYGVAALVVLGGAAVRRVRRVRRVAVREGVAGVPVVD
ncbi:glycosyltransferase 87 family protein [Kitasatospora sp. NPDC094015]|uniref:glycosyltransferase 87 family protein n=1 Tax=Kitasatospora sp. NPDC094015 TaxID=3155205 RepID=UPI00333463BC